MTRTAFAGPLDAMTSHDPKSLGALRDEFFRRHVEAHPEEGSTLGLRACSGRLSDPSPEAARAELAHLRAALAALEDVSLDALDDALRLDLDAVQRVARFHARYLEADADASNLELAAFPSSAMQHAALHARSPADHADVAARARAAPSFLAAHRANLERGLRDGRAPSRAVAQAFVDRILPGAAKATSTLAASGVVPPDVAARASEAFLGFAAFVREAILPAAPALTRLGPEETAFRLRDVMGVEAPVDALLAEARDALAEAHDRMLQTAHVSTLDEARDRLTTLLADEPATLDDALARYRRAIDAATKLAKDRALVPIPEDLALDFAPLPPGMIDGPPFTNWSAPLLERAGRGHALYASDPAAHPRIMAKQLAIHECIPGHYLQSVVWQRRLAGSPERAVRFLGVLDDVAMSRGYFGTMISVEGWAVSMETLMRDQGFFDQDERFFHAWCNAIHAMRVLLDLELHAGDRGWDDLVAMVRDATLMPEGWAASQVVRALRIPLQSSTYLVGAMELAKLRERSKSWLLELHEAVLDHGPVPVSRIRLHAPSMSQNRSQL